MLEIHVPTLICRVASPISCAVARLSLFTSAVTIASKPAFSASPAIVLISEARQPTPGMIPKPSRSAILPLLRFCADVCHGECHAGTAIIHPAGRRNWEQQEGDQPEEGQHKQSS